MLQQIKSLVLSDRSLYQSFTKNGRKPYFLQTRCKYIKHSRNPKIIKLKNYKNSITKGFNNDYFHPFIERLKLSVKKISMYLTKLYII